MRKHAVKISAGSALILILAVATMVGKKPRVVSEKAIPATKSTGTALSTKVVPRLPITALQKTVVEQKQKAPVTVPLSTDERKILSKQLELFQELDVKVLMNPSEKERYIAILNDNESRKLIKRALLTATTENSKMQNASIEFLVSAIESDINISALVKEIIADASIESADTPQAQRQVQAELKAELLYSWSSHNPDEAQNVATLLPGPVSHRIWGNIQSTQANNSEESLIAE